MPPVPSAPRSTDISPFLFFKSFWTLPDVHWAKKWLSLVPSVPGLSNNCMISLILPQADKIELNCIIMYFSAKRWPEQFLQFRPHTFQRAGQFIFAVLPPKIACIFFVVAFFSSTIALGELIVILNMVFLPACPQGKEKIKNEARNYNQAWHM